MAHVESLAGDLKGLLGEGKVLTDPLIVGLYLRDASAYEGVPGLLALPETSEEVSAIVRYAYRRGVPIYPIGSSSSLVGSSVPLEPGIILSMERMNRILEISIPDSIAVAQPGVRLGELNDALAPHGYMFPIDPSSYTIATVGGAINTGAGGLRGAKYGSMRDWVLQLQVVLPDERGSILRLGCRTLKCRQGYDLVRLIVGSEGTLAIVTEATLKITVVPENVATLVAFYPSLEQLMSAVVEIKSSGIAPYMLEFLDRETTRVTAEFLGMGDRVEDAHTLLVGLDSNREASRRIAEKVETILRKHGALRVDRALTMREAEEKGLWVLRRKSFAAAFAHGRRVLGTESVQPLVEDISVPPTRLVEAVQRLREASQRHGIFMMIVGHIGDGNLHPLGFYRRDDPRDAERAREWFLDVMRIAVELGGTTSSEHGIGVGKKEGLRQLEFRGDEKPLELMRGIKRVFDPKGILNPGKVV